MANFNITCGVIYNIDLPVNSESEAADLLNARLPWKPEMGESWRGESKNGEGAEVCRVPDLATECRDYANMTLEGGIDEEEIEVSKEGRWGLPICECPSILCVESLGISWDEWNAQRGKGVMVSANCATSLPSYCTVLEVYETYLLIKLPEGTI